MWNDGDTRKIVCALEAGAKAINRLAKAQEDANRIAVEIEKTRKREIVPDDEGRPDKQPQGILSD
ncbi:MAG TPA: hypothetical protein PKC73_00560 [Dermatophilaceae bacterium]|jgi:hypothetical protein|nr:hypothetical protein [Dermatophilaceae bacterium]